MNAATNMQTISLDAFRKKLKKGGVAYTEGDRAISIKQVASKIGISQSTIRRSIKKGSFPEGRQFTESSVRWLESEIDAWMKSREVANNGM